MDDMRRRQLTFDALKLSLLRSLEEISQEHWDSDWIDGLEYSLWEAVLERKAPFRYGFATVEPETLDDLRDLSELCGGWFHWDGMHYEPSFVTIEVWRKLFAEWRESDAHG